MLQQGEKLFIVHPRLFEKDAPRFFIGEVQVYENRMAKVKGYTFAKEFLLETSRESPNFAQRLSLLSQVA